MAKNTKHLPVYVSSRALAKIVVEQTKEFPRSFRPTLGAMLVRESLELILYIYRANAAENKTEHLTTALEKLHVTEMLLQLSHDLELIAHDAFAECIDLTEQIGKQAGGWRKASKNNIIAASNQPPQGPEFVRATARTTVPKSGSVRDTAKSRNAAYC